MRDLQRAAVAWATLLARADEIIERTAGCRLKARAAARAIMR
jgi:hypothetical protein